MGVIVCAWSGQGSVSDVFLQAPYTPFFASAFLTGLELHYGG